MSSQKNQSLIDGITCLQALAMARGPIGCRELARQLDMNVTRVNRLLMTLEHMGLASKDDKRKYLPGPGIHVLASQILRASPFFRRSLKVIQQFKSRYTLALGLLWRDQVTYIYHGDTSADMVSGLSSGKIYDATGSSIGRVLLAMQNPAAVSDLYRDRDIPHFPGGLPSLLNYLETIRKEQRVIMSPFENIRHFNIAVPVGSPPLAAIALTGIPDEASLATALTEIQVIKEELERQLG